MKRNWQVGLFTAGLLVAAVLAALLMQAYHWTIPCPVRQITGLYCPGCGNTRATLALLRLDLQAVFAYNLMYFPEVFYLIWVYANVCRNYIRYGKLTYGTRWLKWDVAFLIILILWTVIRNVMMLP